MSTARFDENAEADTDDLLDVEDQDTEEEFSVYGVEYRDDV